MNRQRGVSTGALLIGSLLHDEVRNLGKTFLQRTRKRAADYILGAPSYRNYSARKMVDRSLGRLSNRRRPAMKRSMSRGRFKRKRRRTTYRRRGVGSARRAMGSTGPAFRSRMKRSKYRVLLGERIGYMPSRKALTIGEFNSLADKRLHAVRLVSIRYSDDDTLMNVRNGRVSDVIGVKFRAWISLKQNIVQNSVIWNNPIQIRWAVMNPKENTGQDADITAGKNFFMSDSPNTDDAVDFPITGNCFRYMNRKINTRKYGVLQEGSFLLSNDPASTESRVTTNSKKFISFYVPIGRQMKWSNNGTSTADAFPNANLFFVWWFVSQGDPKLPQIFGGNTPFNFHDERITYFKNSDVLG